MSVNSEAIYATRPWKVLGYGPALKAATTAVSFNENKREDLTADDVRFTAKGKTLYAFLMGCPEGQVALAPLALGGELGVGRIGKVDLLGYPAPLAWKQDGTGLRVSLPPQKPCDHAVVFRIQGLA